MTARRWPATRVLCRGGRAWRAPAGARDDINGVAGAVDKLETPYSGELAVNALSGEGTVETAAAGGGDLDRL